MLLAYYFLPQKVDSFSNKLTLVHSEFLSAEFCGCLKFCFLKVDIAVSTKSYWTIKKRKIQLPQHLSLKINHKTIMELGSLSSEEILQGNLMYINF